MVAPALGLLTGWRPSMASLYDIPGAGNSNQTEMSTDGKVAGNAAGIVPLNRLAKTEPWIYAIYQTPPMSTLPATE